MSQVLLNLMVNAAHAIDEGRVDDNEISVVARASAPDHVVIEVGDTGAGMPPDVVARAFDPFFSTKAVGDGSGLGLFICHGIVSRLGGTIALRSEPGVGTTVTVKLPAASADDVQSSRPPIVREARGKASVLIIDDERLVGNALARTLRGHDVRVVTSARDGLALLAEEDFDVIFCDLMMPDVGGQELFEILRERHPSAVPNVVFITGGAFTHRARRFVESIENPCLSKPFDVEEVRSLVAERLGSAEA
jgi:CheY-like chemotaxis protein